MKSVRFTRYWEPIKRGQPYKDGVLYRIYWDGVAYEVTSERSIRQLVANINRMATNQSHDVILLIAEVSTMYWRVYPGLGESSYKTLECMRSIVEISGTIYGEYSYPAYWYNRVRGVIREIRLLCEACESEMGNTYHAMPWRAIVQKCFNLEALTYSMPERCM